jgi:hypothetical protein
VAGAAQRGPPLRDASASPIQYPSAAEEEGMHRRPVPITLVVLITAGVVLSSALAGATQRR